MLGRIIGMLIFLAVYLALEWYVFAGLKTLFKAGMPRALKWTYWLLVIIPVVWMFVERGVFDGQIGQVRGIHNFVIGLFVTLIITKVFFAIFLLVEDVYRVGSYAFGAITNGTEDAKFPGRRRLLAQAGVAVAAVPFVSFLYGITRGKYAYTVFNQQVKFPDLPEAFEGFKIVQISDIHAGSFDSKAAVARGVEMIQAQNPDLILFTGDLVNSKATEIEPYMDLFQALKAPMGKHSVLGNHDYYGGWHRNEPGEAYQNNMKRLFEHHQSMGFNLMNNRSQKIEKNGQSIRLVGVENWGKGGFPKKGDLDKAFAEVADDEFCILMSHDPSHWTQKILDFPKHIHLTLSGHTHGMQMGIEVGRLKWSPSKWIYPQWAGLYKQKEQFLYVNRGFGFLGFPGRVGILPEITVLELKKA